MGYARKFRSLTYHPHTKYTIAMKQKKRQLKCTNMQWEDAQAILSSFRTKYSFAWCKQNNIKCKRVFRSKATSRSYMWNSIDNADALSTFSAKFHVVCAFPFWDDSQFRCILKRIVSELASSASFSEGFREVSWSLKVFGSSTWNKSVYIRNFHLRHRTLAHGWQRYKRNVYVTFLIPRAANSK